MGDACNESGYERSARRSERQRGRRETESCQRPREMSHGGRRLVPRSILEDGNVDVGRSEECCDREESLEEMGDDLLRVEEVQGEVETLRLPDVRRGFVSFIEREEVCVAGFEEGWKVALTRNEGWAGDG